MAEYYDVHDPNLLEEECVDLCKDHYLIFKNIKGSCSLCNKRVKDQKCIRQIRNAKLSVAKYYAKTKNIEGKLSSVSHSCTTCLKKLYAFERNLPDGWQENTGTINNDDFDNEAVTSSCKEQSISNTNTEIIDTSCEDFKYENFDTIMFSSTMNHDQQPITETEVVHDILDNDVITANIQLHNSESLIEDTHILVHTQSKTINDPIILESTEECISNCESLVEESQMLVHTQSKTMNDNIISATTENYNSESLSLSGIKSKYLDKLESINCQGNQCDSKALYECIIYVCDKFSKNLAILLNTLYDLYIKKYTLCHPCQHMGLRLKNQTQLEKFLKVCFGNNGM